MPRSVYWPLRHMSHSSVAHGRTGRGRAGVRCRQRDGPPRDLPHPPSFHAPEQFMAEHEPLVTGRRPAVRRPPRSRGQCRRRRAARARRAARRPSARGRAAPVQLGAVGTPGNDRHRAHQRGKSFTTESRQSVMMSWKPVGRRTSRQMPARRYRAISLPSWRAWKRIRTAAAGDGRRPPAWPVDAEARVDASRVRERQAPQNRVVDVQLPHLAEDSAAAEPARLASSRRTEDAAQ